MESINELDRELPVLEPYFVQHPELAGKTKNGIRITWLGHASVMVEMDDLIFLTDPIFSHRASPFSFAGPKRFRGPPCTIEMLPKIDAVVISHNHYDHLDYNTVLGMNARFGTELRWFVPLGLLNWMQSCGCENVIELDWWEQNCVPGHDEVTFVFTPCQHWCKRTPFDDNKVLWGSWSVLGPSNRFYFAGDTGYCAAFEQIGKRFGPFDVAAIPIGAYEPRWFMKKNQHVDPEEAVRIHADVRAKKSVAIHWGTFALANEGDKVSATKKDKSSRKREDRKCGVCAIKLPVLYKKKLCQSCTDEVLHTEQPSLLENIKSLIKKEVQSSVSSLSQTLLPQPPPPKKEENICGRV
ncbi:unnamed protein product [Ranitomeya imitator]|uniref:Metallo-beta-lactamase domain-containing protein n=1 Tax=Ranitomeya imitator TaxID=111125 RepID=A0ABN9LU05_9NEOB|nr:unnamed protein product [Ranitomeya imitator]